MLCSATHLLVRQLAGPLVEVDVSLPQDDVGVTSANTLRPNRTGRQCHNTGRKQCDKLSVELWNHRRAHLDGGDGEGDLPPAIDVRVENTKNVLELLRDDQRLKTRDMLTGQRP